MVLSLLAFFIKVLVNGFLVALGFGDNFFATNTFGAGVWVALSLLAFFIAMPCYFSELEDALSHHHC